MCTTTNNLWRSNASEINSELYSGYVNVSSGVPVLNEYTGAYDFQYTNFELFSPLVYYNATKRNSSGSQGPPPEVIRIARSINLVSTRLLV